MQKANHIVIIAGEESGDLHAAVLVKQLKNAYPNLKVSGIGGRHMEAEGVELVADLARYGVTGFTEVIRYFNVIKKAFSAIKNHLIQNKPDLLILVDYPGFNLRLAQFAKNKLGLKIIYYISPQIWAWKANRIHTIKQCVDRMAVILPFEKELYQQANIPVTFVGHPLVEKIPNCIDSTASRITLGLPQKNKIIALLPGSRTHEIERHMPILVQMMQLLLIQNHQYHFVIPVAGTVKLSQITAYLPDQSLPVSIIEGKAIECMAAADFVVVASGTASLECALLKKPMCIIYKSSFLTYHLAMKLIRVKYLGLCNLLSKKMLVPEFLQYDCNPAELARYITDFNQDSNQPDKIINQLSELKQSLSSSESDCSLFDLVKNELSQK